MFLFFLNFQFRTAVAETLKIIATDIFDVVASTERRRLLNYIDRRQLTESCTVKYKVRVESKEKIASMTQVMTNKFKKNDAFTAAFKKQIKANGVTTVSVDEITTDTRSSTTDTTTTTGTTTDTTTGTTISSDDSVEVAEEVSATDTDTVSGTSSESNSGSVILAVVLVFVACALVIAVYIVYTKNQKDTQGIEMIGPDSDIFIFPSSRRNLEQRRIREKTESNDADHHVVYL